MEYPEEWNSLPKRERNKKIRDSKAQEVTKSILINKLFRSKLRNIPSDKFVHSSPSVSLDKIHNWGIVLVVAVPLIGGAYYWSTNREVLPPTDMTGHIEQNPPSHIMDESMSLSVQKHMLEHSDGKGPPGVVINYNCEDFGCDSDLKDRLTEIANKYPEFVYIAPFPNMSKKIAITRMGKIQTFNNLDENALVQFIEGR